MITALFLFQALPSVKSQVLNLRISDELSKTSMNAIENAYNFFSSLTAKKAKKHKSADNKSIRQAMMLAYYLKADLQNYLHPSRAQRRRGKDSIIQLDANYADHLRDRLLDVVFVFNILMSQANKTPKGSYRRHMRNNMVVVDPLKMLSDVISGRIAQNDLSNTITLDYNEVAAMTPLITAKINLYEMIKTVSTRSNVQGNAKIDANSTMTGMFFEFLNNVYYHMREITPGLVMNENNLHLDRARTTDVVVANLMLHKMNIEIFMEKLRSVRPFYNKIVQGDDQKRVDMYRRDVDRVVLDAMENLIAYRRLIMNALKKKGQPMKEGGASIKKKKN